MGECVCLRLTQVCTVCYRDDNSQVKSSSTEGSRYLLIQDTDGEFYIYN